MERGILETAIEVRDMKTWMFFVICEFYSTVSFYSGADDDRIRFSTRNPQLLAESTARLTLITLMYL